MCCGVQEVQQDHEGGDEQNENVDDEVFDQREVGPWAPSSQGSSATPPPPGNSPLPSFDESDDTILRLATECLQTDLSEREMEVKSDKR